MLEKQHILKIGHLPIEVQRLIVKRRKEFYAASKQKFGWWVSHTYSVTDNEVCMYSNSRGDEITRTLWTSSEKVPLPTCPHCGGEILVKPLSAAEKKKQTAVEKEEQRERRNLVAYYLWSHQGATLQQVADIMQRSYQRVIDYRNWGQHVEAQKLSALGKLPARFLTYQLEAAKIWTDYTLEKSKINP